MIRTITYPKRPAVQVEIRDPLEHQQKHWLAGNFYEASRIGLVNWIDENVRPGSVVVDVGASIGNHTLFMAKCLGCKVIAIEPVAESLDHLYRHITLNGVERDVEVHEVAVGHAEGHCRMQHVLEHNAGMWEMRPGDAVRVTTLDRIVGPRRISYIKIDVEHTEIAVLDGAIRLLRAYKPLLSIECTDDPIILDERLIPLGYSRDDIVLNHTPTYIYRWRSPS